MIFDNLFLLIAALYTAAVSLDNYGTFRLIVKFKSDIIASNYVKRGQIDFISRGLLFFAPPFLGILLINNQIEVLLNTFLFTAFLCFIATCLQCFWFFKKIKERFIKKIILSNLLLILIGSIVYSIHLFVPFYLNIISFYFQNQALWIVQLSPGITSISTAFIVYYLDPQIAKFIDSNFKNRNSSVLLNILFFRVFGRLIVLIISIYFVLDYGYI